MPASVPEPPVIRFGPFELALETGELRRDGAPIRLQPQPAKVLALLASRPGELVTREEIRRQVWDGDTFVDFEHGVNFCVKEIRAALGDSARTPSYVETLPRRGYRFVAPVEAAAVPAPTNEASSRRALAARRRHFPSRLGASARRGLRLAAGPWQRDPARRGAKRGRT